MLKQDLYYPLTDKAYLLAKAEVLNLLAPFTNECRNISNITYARLTNPLSTFTDDLLPEEWVPLVYSNIVLDRYLISSWGRVFDKKYNRIPFTHLCDKGYARIGLRPINSNSKSNKAIRIHRLVGNTFIPRIKDKPHLNHKDLNKTNNAVGNLEWCTDEENIDHAITNGAWMCRKDYNYFTKEEGAEVKKRHDNGESAIDIAKSFNRGVESIRKLIRGVTYVNDHWNRTRSK